MNTTAQIHGSTSLPLLPLKVESNNWAQYSLVAAGIALTGYSLLRRNPVAVIASGAGLYAAATLARDTIQKLTAIDDNTLELSMEQVGRAITIGRPVDEVFALARDLENVPRFLPAISAVEQINRQHSVWRIKTFALIALIDTELTAEVENEYIGVGFSYHGNRFADCLMRFKAPAPNRTEITMLARYHPLMGGLMDRVLRPVVILEADTFLMRVKQLAETGEIARSK